MVGPRDLRLAAPELVVEAADPWPPQRNVLIGDEAQQRAIDPAEAALGVPAPDVALVLHEALPAHPRRDHHQRGVREHVVPLRSAEATLNEAAQARVEAAEQRV